MTEAAEMLNRALGRSRVVLQAGVRQWHDLWSYLKRAPGQNAQVAPALIRLAWSSIAALAIAPLHDLLNLSKGGRMNVPGRAEGNWRWRGTEDMLSLPAFQWLRDFD